MRVILLLLLIALMANTGFSQDLPKKEIKKPIPEQVPSKKQTHGQLADAINQINDAIADLEKQLADAIKNNEDEETTKDLRDQIAMLKKQVEMIGGLSKTVSKVSDKTFQEAGKVDPIAPKKDITRINMLPKNILTEAELALRIKNIHSQVERMIPALEKTEALKVYNETKEKYKSVVVTANAATGFWMLGHWEKALFIMGKVCIDDITDADNLNNYASFLISTGGEQAAIPILLYLDSKYPDNSTIKNNIGQAWFGLGDMENAKKLLDETRLLYPGHSMANATLSNVYQAEGNNQKAISFLKASLKESYDTEKEQQLLKLGYKITYADMPPFDYPMKSDPLGLIPFLNTWDPNTIQKNVGDIQGALALQRYLNGIRDFKKELDAENAIIGEEERERGERLANDKPYNQELLDPFNCPPYLQAARSLQLLTFDKPQGSSPLLTQLWLPYIKPIQNQGEIPLDIGEIIKDCQAVWDNEVAKPMSVLAEEYTNWLKAHPDRDCETSNQLLNAYLEKRAEIYGKGVELIKTEFVSKSRRLDAWILLNLYATIDPAPTIDESTAALVSHLRKTISRNKFKNSMYADIVGNIDFAQAFAKTEKNLCPHLEGPELAPGTIDYSDFNLRIVDCEFQKEFITPIRYRFKLHCNNWIVEKNPKLEERKPDINKGSVQNSTSTNQNPGPLQTRGGPNDISYEEENYHKIQPGPLSAENKVISQCYIEYNKWGNFVGFKFQLNEDRTDLKDPDSNESGIDSRWSWNAIASPKKGFLNKLVIK